MSSISFFSVVIGIGASFGLLWVTVTSPTAQRLHWLLAGWVTLTCALIGARAGFVLEHLPYFSSHAVEIPQFWLGGLTWEGAIIGGLLSFILIVKLWHWPFLLVMDHLSRLVLPLGVAGWAGIWWSGLGYGVPLEKGTWWGLLVPDESGLISLRTPVQPLAIFSLIVFLGVLELWLNRREKIGLRGMATLLIFSADMLLFSFLRADPAQNWLGFRFETWLAMVYTLIGVLGTIYLFRKKNRVLTLRRPIKESKSL